MLRYYTVHVAICVDQMLLKVTMSLFKDDALYSQITEQPTNIVPNRCGCLQPGNYNSELKISMDVKKKVRLPGHENESKSVILS